MRSLEATDRIEEGLNEKLRETIGAYAETTEEYNRIVDVYQNKKYHLFQEGEFHRSRRQRVAKQSIEDQLATLVLSLRSISRAYRNVDGLRNVPDQEGFREIMGYNGFGKVFAAYPDLALIPQLFEVTSLAS